LKRLTKSGPRHFPDTLPGACMAGLPPLCGLGMLCGLERAASREFNRREVPRARELTR
jgi:hypothetical protein